MVEMADEEEEQFDPITEVGEEAEEGGEGRDSMRLRSESKRLEDFMDCSFWLWEFSLRRDSWLKESTCCSNAAERDDSRRATFAVMGPPRSFEIKRTDSLTELICCPR